MTITKSPTTASYKVIFIFAIAMSFVALLAGNKGGIGTLFWGYVAWMMYKRNINNLDRQDIGLILILGTLVVGFFLFKTEFLTLEIVYKFFN